jgi:hypothetical protein
MLSWLTAIFLDRHSQSASRRADQCVTPAACRASGGGVTVADRISLITRWVSTVLGPPGPRRVFQPGQPALGVLAPPFDHRRLGAPHPLGDLRAGQPLSGQQHDPGPFGHPRWRAPVPHPPLQLGPVSIGHRQHTHAIGHGPLSRTTSQD